MRTKKMWVSAMKIISHLLQFRLTQDNLVENCMHGGTKRQNISLETMISCATTLGQSCIDGSGGQVHLKLALTETTNLTTSQRQEMSLWNKNETTESMAGYE